MKIGPRVCAIMAFGALSTQAAVSGQHGHRTSAAAGRSVTGAPNLAKSPAAVGNHQGPGPAVMDGGGAAADAAPKSTPPVPHGLQRAATPATGADGKQGDAQAPIETRITLHQGRETTKGKVRPFKKTNLAIGSWIGPKHEPVHDFHQKSPVATDGSRRHNAIGAIVVEHDKPAVLSKRTGVVPPPDGASPRVDATLHDPNTRSAIGTVPNELRAPTTQRSAVTVRAPLQLRVVTANGPSVTGTGMARAGSATPVVGGPPKIVAGVLSGIDVRPKHL
jgi:hypothetical protein